ncbi:Uncharacterized protein HZ326_9392 [Fusarium oxysporum f. sp. albedinis]|nr:Uncharacterized protein HZ326_9392 [Fusarium oxysporum f. sp. albedinis]
MGNRRLISCTSDTTYKLSCAIYTSQKLRDHYREREDRECSALAWSNGELVRMVIPSTCKLELAVRLIRGFAFLA